MPPSLRVCDPVEALEQARLLGCIREELDTAAYRQKAEQALKENGALLPGTERTEPRESFSIRLGNEKGAESPD